MSSQVKLAGTIADLAGSEEIRTLGRGVAIPSEVDDRRAAFLSEEAELQIVSRVVKIYSPKQSSEKKSWL